MTPEGPPTPRSSIGCGGSSPPDHLTSMSTPRAPAAARDPSMVARGNHLRASRMPTQSRGSTGLERFPPTRGPPGSVGVGGCRERSTGLHQEQIWPPVPRSPGSIRRMDSSSEGLRQWGPRRALCSFYRPTCAILPRWARLPSTPGGGALPSPPSAGPRGPRAAATLTVTARNWPRESRVGAHPALESDPAPKGQKNYPRHPTRLRP